MGEFMWGGAFFGPVMNDLFPSQSESSHGFVILRAMFDQWMAGKVEEAGAAARRFGAVMDRVDVKFDAEKKSFVQTRPNSGERALAVMASAASGRKSTLSGPNRWNPLRRRKAQPAKWRAP